MKKTLFKFGMGIVAAGMLTSVGVVIRDMALDERGIADVRATLTPTALPVLLAEVPLLLVTSNGQLQLREAPGSEQISVIVAEGVMVEAKLLERRWVGEQDWFLLALVDRPGQGWVPSETLSLTVSPARSFGDFRFCLGDSAGPNGPCGTSLSLPERALWLSWSFHGLERGDTVQRVLVVNGERYQLPPEAWQGAADGQQLVNLLADHSPRVETGLWTVQFHVNGDLVGEASVYLH